jgi:hypothetical protein
MTSFIELPRLQFGGRDQESLYVNTADILTLVANYDGQTRIEVRCLGTEGMTAGVLTYVPLGALLNVLGELAKFPGVRSWADDTKAGWREPIRAKLQYSAEQERSRGEPPH